MPAVIGAFVAGMLVVLIGHVVRTVFIRDCLRGGGRRVFQLTHPTACTFLEIVG